MTISSLKPFFYLNEPASRSKAKYQTGFFLRRFQPYIKQRQIIAAQEGRGAVIIGQIPIANEQCNLINLIKKNGMVVSCADYSELFSLGNSLNIIPSSRWSDFNIMHHQLPSTDSNIPHADLVCHTLQKMLDIYHQGGNIYIHCTPGATRSNLIAILFKCITHPLNSHDDFNVADIFNLTINELQLAVNNQQRLFGITLLNKFKGSYYISPPKTEEVHADFKDEERVYVTEECLKEIAQEPCFKFLCQQAYQNPHAFPIINKFTQSLYEFAENNVTDVSSDEIYQVAFNNLTSEERTLIVNVMKLYEKCQYLTNTVKNHIPILSPTLDFNEKIINSFLSYEEMIFWVKTITNYLDEPDNEGHSLEYKKLYDHAITIGNPALRKLGISMMVLGIAIVSISLITISIAVGGPWSVGFLLLASSCLGGLGIGMGKLMHSVGRPDELCSAFLEWDTGVKKCDDFPYQAPQEAGYGNK